MSIDLTKPAAPPPPPNRGVLKGMIRCTGALLVLVSAVLLIAVVPAWALERFQHVRFHAGAGRWSWPVAGTLLVAVEVLLCVLFKIGWDMFRPVTKASAGYFAFIIAVLVTGASYEPVHYVLVRCVAYLTTGHTASIPVDPVSLNRILSWLAHFFVFLIFYKLLKIIIVRRLALPPPPAKK